MNRLKVFILIPIIFLIISCERVELVADRVIDYRYNESYVETVTDYKNKYNVMSDTWQYLPDIHTEYHPESYELLHEYTYSDGTITRKWLECTHIEYLNAKKILD